MSFEQIWFK